MNLKRLTLATWIAAMLAAAAAALLAASPAFAAPSIDTIVPTQTYSKKCATGLSNATLCKTDNASVTYYMDSSGEYELEDVDRTAAKSAVGLYRDNTDLTVTYDSTPVFSGSGETDVIFQEGDFGMSDSTIGITWCNDASADYECDQQYIRVRGGGNYDADTAGHEFGHAVGATHGAQASPVQSQCASAMGVMRAFEDCRPSASLGSLLISNINYRY